MEQAGVDWNSIKQDAKTILQQRAKNPQAAQQNEAQLYQSMGNLFSGDATDADRQNTVNWLVNNTTMSQQEATQKVAAWEQQFQQLEQKARQVGHTAATGVATTGWVLFGLLLVGAISAAVGGASGTPKYLRTTTTTPQSA